MQNLLKILLRYSNFLVFIALEVAAFLLISFNNVYPRSSMLSTANEVVAWQHATLSNNSAHTNANNHFLTGIPPLFTDPL